MTYRPVKEHKTQNGHSADFLKRILDALDMTPMEASVFFDVPLADILAMYRGTRKRLIAIDQDETWVKLAEHVNDRIGKLLAVRTELQRKLNLDRAERQAQRLRTLNR